MSNELESSIIVTAVIACNRCDKISTNEEWQNDIPYVAKMFYEDGWRVVDGLALCPDCVQKIPNQNKK